MYKTILFLFAVVISANAQQTIFNVPSVDIMDKKKVYVEFDAAFKPNSQEALRRFSSFTPRIVVGIGGRTEIGMNVIGNVQPGEDSTTLVPTIKKKFYEKNNTVLTAGTNFYVPVRNRSYKFGTYSYLAVGKTYKKTRLSAGAFVASKNVFAANAVRGGGQFGFEQTINSKITLSADWITGKHSNGYVTPGLVYKPNSNVIVYLAYPIGNTDAKKGNHFFLFETGYYF
jgi:hypothetical protein